MDVISPGYTLDLHSNLEGWSRVYGVKAEGGIVNGTEVQTCPLPISPPLRVDSYGRQNKQKRADEIT